MLSSPNRWQIDTSVLCAIMLSETLFRLHVAIEYAVFASISLKVKGIVFYSILFLNVFCSWEQSIRGTSANVRQT